MTTTPLALAVIFAMLTSYLLSRTLVPTMVHYLLAGEVEMYGGELDPDDPHAQHALEHKDHLAHGDYEPTFWERTRARLAELEARLQALEGAAGPAAGVSAASEPPAPGSSTSN